MTHIPTVSDNKYKYNIKEGDSPLLGSPSAKELSVYANPERQKQTKLNYYFTILDSEECLK